MNDLPDRDAKVVTEKQSLEIIDAYMDGDLKSRDEMNEDAVWELLARNVGDVWASRLSRRLLDAAWGVDDE